MARKWKEKDVIITNGIIHLLQESEYVVKVVKDMILTKECVHCSNAPRCMGIFNQLQKAPTGVHSRCTGVHLRCTPVIVSGII